MLYSIKMRSAQGGAHEEGGRHISGAERILPEEQLDYAVLTMLHRAREHERGRADFISLKVEEIKPQDIVYKPLLIKFQHLPGKNGAGRAPGGSCRA